jgi:hypothetical protein
MESLGRVRLTERTNRWTQHLDDDQLGALSGRNRSLPLGFATRLTTLGNRPSLGALSAAEVDKSASQNAVPINDGRTLTVGASLNCAIGRRWEGHKPRFGCVDESFSKCAERDGGFSEKCILLSESRYFIRE